MTDNNRDPYLSQLLTAEPVPDHAGDFWSKLDERMAAAERAGHVVIREPDTRPSHTVDVVRRERDEVVKLMERRAPRWGRDLALAGAAVVLILAVTFGLRRTGDDRVRTDDPGVTTPITAPPVAGETDAISAVQRFINAMGAGDTAQATTMLGPRSEEYLNATAGSVDVFLRGAVTDGYGAWAKSTDKHLWALAVRPGEFVVVLKGTHPGENAPAVQTDVIPVRHAESADAWFVEPWAFDPSAEGRIELLNPDPSAALPSVPNDGVRVSRPQADGRLWFGFDRTPLEEVTPQGTPSEASWNPSPRPTGQHVLVVVYETDVTFTALARTVEVP